MTTAKDLKTPCFVLDRDEMQRGIHDFAAALGTYFPRHVVGYSVKTNSLPRLLQIARDGGCCAEVVSYTEYALAKALGFAPQHIIYNGPLKDKETFTEALLAGAMVNIESWREIEWLHDVAAQAANGREVRCGIRLNIIISEVFGHQKPDPAAYRFFMEAYPAEAYVYVSDNTKKDFLAPNRLGWETVCLLDDGTNIHPQDFSLEKDFLPKRCIHRLSEMCG